MSETTMTMMEPDLLGPILKQFEDKKSPLSAADLATNDVKAALGLPKKTSKAKTEPALLERLEEMVQSGQLFRYHPEKKNAKPVFFTGPVEEFAKRTIRSVIEKEPSVSWAEAKKSSDLKALSKFLLAKQQDGLLKELVKNGSVFEWPKTGKKGSTVRHSLQRADAREYLEPAIEKYRKELKALAEKLQHAGVGYEDLMNASRLALAAPETTDIVALMLEMMEEVEPAARNGAAVPIVGLRHAMEFQNLDKESFDNAILRMAERAILDLHRYDYPAGLSQAERDDLISDGQGGYFVAVARRV